MTGIQLETAMRDMSIRWKSGDKVRTESYLEHYPELLDPKFLIEIVYQEITLGVEAGIQVDLPDYQGRFPSIARELELQWHIDQELFEGQSDTRSVIENEPNKVSTAPIALPVDRGDEVRQLLDPPIYSGEIGVLGHYRILETLGWGGMGVVFSALDERLKRKVALKVMRPKFAANSEARSRFLREARAMAAVEHPNIVTVYEVSTANGLPLIAMQLLRGESLQKRLNREKKLNGEKTTHIAIGITAGLAAAHANGLVHRDIKPGNIWLEPDGGIKLLDFGLVRSQHGDAHHSNSGEIIGTPGYMSPEQITGPKVDNRTDLFSLGCVIYRCLTGQLPFDRPTVVDTLRDILSKEPIDIKTLVPDAPYSLVTLTRRLLQKKPELRPAHAKECINLLCEKQNNPWSEIDIPPSSDGTQVILNSPQKRLSLNYAVIGLFMLAAIGVGIQFIRSQSNGNLLENTQPPETNFSNVNSSSKQTGTVFSTLVMPEDIAAFQQVQSIGMDRLDASKVVSNQVIPPPPGTVAILGSVQGKLGNRDALTNITINSNGRWLARSSATQLMIWNATNLEPVFWRTFPATIGKLAFSDSGSTLHAIIRTTEGMRMVSIDCEQFPPKYTQSQPLPFTIQSFALSIEHAFVAGNGIAELPNRETSRLVRFGQDNSRITHIATNANGDHIVALNQLKDDNRCSLIFWNKTDGRWVEVAKSQTGFIDHGIAYSQSGNLAYVIGIGENNKTEFQEISTSDGKIDVVRRAICPSDTHIHGQIQSGDILLNCNGVLRIWSLKDWKMGTEMPPGMVTCTPNLDRKIINIGQSLEIVGKDPVSPKSAIAGDWQTNQPIVGNDFALTFHGSNWTNWDLSGSSAIASNVGFGYPVSATDLNRDCTRLATINKQTGAIHIHTIERGKPKQAEFEMNSFVQENRFINLLWHPDGKRLISRRIDGTIEMWNFNENKPVAKKIGSVSFGNHPSHMTINPAGTVLIALDQRSLNGWNLRQTPTKQLVISELDPGPMGFINDGRDLVSCGIGPRAGIKKLDLSKRVTKPIAIDERSVYKLSISCDGRWALAVEPESDRLSLIDIVQNQQVWNWRTFAGIDSMRFAPDQRHCLICTSGLAYVVRIKK